MNGPVPTSQPVLSFAEECDRGKVRPENQDTVLHARTELGELLVVADGIGGLAGGAVASRIVVESIYKHLQTLPGDYPAAKAVHEAAAIANANILAAAAEPDAPYKRMGSTVVLALIQQPAHPESAELRAWIGHVGDSRAYLLRDGRLQRITKDHSAVQELLDDNLLRPEDAGTHPEASVLTRSLGHYADVEIDVEAASLLVGDSLLLCSDGLWGFVPEQEIQAVMADAHLPLEATAKTLLDMALAAGGHDNIGIELVRVSLPPSPAPEVAQQSIETEEMAGARTPPQIDGQPQENGTIKNTQPSRARVPQKAQEPLKLGFAGILLLCLLAGAALGTFLYLVFYGR